MLLVHSELSGIATDPGRSRGFQPSKDLPDDRQSSLGVLDSDVDIATTPVQPGASADDLPKAKPTQFLVQLVLIVATAPRGTIGVDTQTPEAN
jgi:hypothetical protein